MSAVNEDVWELEVQLHAFLNSALDGSEWLVSHPLNRRPGDPGLDAVVPIWNQTLVVQPAA
jgi:hypothetical protein